MYLATNMSVHMYMHLLTVIVGKWTAQLTIAKLTLTESCNLYS